MCIRSAHSLTPTTLPRQTEALRSGRHTWSGRSSTLETDPVPTSGEGTNRMLGAPTGTPGSSQNSRMRTDTKLRSRPTNLTFTGKTPLRPHRALRAAGARRWPDAPWEEAPWRPVPSELAHACVWSVRVPCAVSYLCSPYGSCSSLWIWKRG